MSRVLTQCSSYQEPTHSNSYFDAMRMELRRDVTCNFSEYSVPGFACPRRPNKILQHLHIVCPRRPVCSSGPRSTARLGFSAISSLHIVRGTVYVIVSSSSSSSRRRRRRRRRRRGCSFRFYFASTRRFGPILIAFTGSEPWQTCGEMLL